MKENQLWSNLSTKTQRKEQGTRIGTQAKLLKEAKKNWSIFSCRWWHHRLPRKCSHGVMDIPPVFQEHIERTYTGVQDTLLLNCVMWITDGMSNLHEQKQPSC